MLTFAVRALALGTLLLTFAGYAAYAAGPCTTQLADVPAKPGAYVPQCTPAGYYEMIQIHGSTGHSWCANPQTGVKIEGTDKAPGAGDPACPPCISQLVKALFQPLAGAYLPQCDGSGDFKKKQFSAATGLAWCADPKTGAKLTSPVKDDGTLSCK